MALIFTAYVFWDPARFAANTSSLQIWQSIFRHA
nr:hypothetical protein [Photorhabdus sp. CRI-LC]